MTWSIGSAQLIFFWSGGRRHHPSSRSLGLSAQATHSNLKIKESKYRHIFVDNALHFVPPAITTFGDVAPEAIKFLEKAAECTPSIIPARCRCQLLQNIQVNIVRELARNFFLRMLVSGCSLQWSREVTPLRETGSLWTRTTVPSTHQRWRRRRRRADVAAAQKKFRKESVKTNLPATTSFLPPPFDLAFLTPPPPPLAFSHPPPLFFYPLSLFPFFPSRLVLVSILPL